VPPQERVECGERSGMGRLNSKNRAPSPAVRATTARRIAPLAGRSEGLPVLSVFVQEPC
jgi:hypothetical protein